MNIGEVIAHILINELNHFAMQRSHQVRGPRDLKLLEPFQLLSWDVLI